MHLNRMMKHFCTFSVTLFLLVCFLLPSSILASIQINENDGIWTDSFGTSDTTELLTGGTSRCVWEQGLIQLATTSSGGRNYSFADGGGHQYNEHRAYYYQSYFPINRFFFFAFSPLRHTAREHGFDDEFQYPNIEKKGETTQQFAYSSTKGTEQYVVHHFRIKLQGNADSIGNLYIYWYGKAENAKKIEMFYWDYGSILSTWKRMNYTKTTGYTFFVYNLSKTKVANAISSDNYIDFCVVAQKNSILSPQCTIYTDYVQVRSKQQVGYKIGYGYVQTKDPINLRPYAYWESLIWDDFESGSATARYQVLYNNGTTYIPIENEILPGNEEGFTTSPVSLVPLSDFYSSIKIRGNLSTNDPSVTPKIFSWTVTWQSTLRWQDLFSTEYRVDVNNHLNINNAVNISLVSGEWPMFGQNPENTRTSFGKAAVTNTTYWWTDFNDYNKKRNQTLSDPVVNNGALYLPIINRDGANGGTGSLYKYSSIAVDSTNVGKENLHIQSFSKIANGQKIIGSPTVTDKYVIVATGDEDSHNYVYAFDKNLPSSDPEWTFDYNPPTKICYWGSPIVADGKVFLTSWSGQPTMAGYHINNRVFALDLSSGHLIWNFTFPEPSNPLLALKSSTWSFSTPAYSDGKLIVGCMNNQSDNLFALESENGSVLWNSSVGAIGKSSPVIYENTVYIINEQRVLEGIRRKTKVTALNLDDGSIRWEKTLGRTLTTLPNLDLTTCLAQSTPAIADGILYATSPDGLVSALNLSSNGTVLSTQEIFSNFLNPMAPILTSSPAYANGLVYVGTPDGFMYALSMLSKDKILWSRQTFPKDQSVPIVTNPVVTNGLVFFGAENSRLYVLGNFSKSLDQINGSLTSVPIELPVGVWWKKFYASVSTSADPTYNKITFSLLDNENNLIKTLYNGSDILEPGKILGRTLRLHAELWAKNITYNPRLLSWGITFIKDIYPPFIDMNTLTPNPHGWLNVIIPQFTVDVQDSGTGLLVNSAEFVLGYVANNQTYTNVFKADCTGVNGTNLVEQITMNISKLPIFQNITALRSLRINISDLAGNLASQYVLFQQDTTKPSSHVLASLLRPRYNATSRFVWVNTTSFDNGSDASGVHYVRLFYRYSTTGNFSGDWNLFANSTVSSPSWKFNFTQHPNQKGGYFEVCTVATDYAQNTEDFPTHGDASFVYDWEIPDFPSYSGDTLWFNERPMFTVTFSDDFQLDTIQYRTNFAGNWITIATDVNESTYNKPWSLQADYWDQMEEDVVYYLYFRINDTLGNTLTVTDNTNAIIIRKDISLPTIAIEQPSVKKEAVLGDNFTVSAEASDSPGSGVKDVLFYYRFSTDNSNWSAWTQYGSAISTTPYEWAFNATHGDGYYELMMNVTDNAGNVAESSVVTVVISTFPMIYSIVLIGLVVVLLLLCAIIYIKWKKRK